MSKEFTGATLEMWLTPDMEETMKEQFNIEMEMLHGTRNTEPDGKIYLCVQIMDEQKAEMIKEFLLKVLSQSHKQILN